MANVEHSTLTGSDLHEPKGIAAAAANRAYISNGAGSGTWSQVPAAAIAAAGVLVFQSQFYHARNELASGTDGNTLTVSTWNTRAIDTEKTDDLSITLSGNQFTLTTGTYYVECQAVTSFLGLPPRGGTQDVTSKLRLRNITDSTSTLTGLGSKFHVNDDGGGNNEDAEVHLITTVSGRFAIVGSKVFEIQNWVTNNWNSPVTKAGKAISSGENEVYLDLKIWKTA